MPTIRSHYVYGWISRQPQATWTSSCRGRGSCRSFLFPPPDVDLPRMRGGAMAMAVETKRWRITVERDHRRCQPCKTHTHIPCQRVSSLSSLSLSLSAVPSHPKEFLLSLLSLLYNHSLSFLFTRSLSTLRSLFVPSTVVAVSLYSPYYCRSLFVRVAFPSMAKRDSSSWSLLVSPSTRAVVRSFAPQFA